MIAAVNGVTDDSLAAVRVASWIDAEWYKVSPP